MSVDCGHDNSGAVERLRLIRSHYLPWDQRILELEQAVRADDPAPEAINKAIDHVKRLVEASKLADALDDLTNDHKLSEAEFRRLWRSPKTAAREAVTLGQYRERRLVIEGKVASTNWMLGLGAFFAAFVALVLEVVRGFG